MVISSIKVDESLKYIIVIGRILDWANYGIACVLKGRKLIKRTAASHHYTFTSILNYFPCKFISWANEIFQRKLIKPYKLIQDMSVKKV